MYNSALQRIAHKAGATRVSSEVYNRARSIGDRYLDSIVKYAIIYCDNEKKKIVTADHALRAIEHVGFSGMYRVSGDIPKCKISNKKNLIARIIEYQNQSGCVTLSKAPIEHQIKSLGNKYKWSKDVIF